MKKSKKGFTIVELVIVIAVIGILAAVLIPTFGGVIDKANKSAALQEATSVMKATLAMSQTATLAEDTIFVIGDSKGVTYEFKYEGNKIKEREFKQNTNEYAKLIPINGGSLNDQASGVKYDRIIINSDLIANTAGSYSWKGTTEYKTVEAIIREVFNVKDDTEVKIQSRGTATVGGSGVDKDNPLMTDASATCECVITIVTGTGEPLETETYAIAVYVNSDYPTDAVTFVPATRSSN